jgi:cholestenol delta-isomerase
LFLHLTLHRVSIAQSESFLGIIEMAETMENTTNHFTDHPYYPKHVVIASYLANEYSVTVLLGAFTTICVSIVIGTLFIVKKSHPNLPSLEKAAIWWFITCK